MKPIEFEGANCTYGEKQEEYLPLPAYKAEDGRVITCWELTPEEIEVLKETKRVYVELLTFNRPLQPMLVSVDKEELMQAEVPEKKGLAGIQDDIGLARCMTDIRYMAIPWEEHMKIYEGYSAKYGNAQSAERISQRGGFGIREAVEEYGWPNPCTILVSDKLSVNLEDWDKVEVKFDDDFEHFVFSIKAK